MIRSFLVSIILAVLALAVLILVHELGHFLAAKACGVHVERFSIGFGKALLSKKIGETEYCISLIPLGGYVKLHRMIKEEEPDLEDPDSVDMYARKESAAFYNKPYYKKMVIILAGVFFNMVFAVILMSTIFMSGYKSSSPVVGSVDAEGPAMVAGFMPGDKVVSVMGMPVRSWEEFYIELSRKATSAKVVVARDGREVTLDFPIEKMEYTNLFGEPEEGVNLGMSVRFLPIIGDVSPGYPAALAGIKAGDTIVSIDGNAVSQWADIPKYIAGHVDETPINLEIERKGAQMSFDIVPQKSPSGSNIIGIMALAGDITIKENPAKALAMGFKRTAESTYVIYKSIWMLVSGKVSKDNLGGPILIMQEASKSAKDGLERYLAFTAIISVNLAILNLLPVPILDGGHAVVYTYERLRRKPISMTVRENSQKIGFALLSLLMIFAFYNDIVRFIKSL